MRFDGKVVLVTGGGSGIGAAAARLFAEAGAAVAVSGRTEAKLRAVAEEICQRGYRCVACPGDAADPREAATVVADVEARLGGLDIVFLNAGTYRGGGLLETTPDVWDEQMRNNARAAYATARAAIPALRHRGGGVMIFNASTIGLRPVPGVAAYCAGKAAVAMVARSVALEHGADGIRSVCIAPGIVDTPIHDPKVAPGGKRADVLAGATAGQPIPRPGTPEDVAHMALFLASDEASWVTGDVVAVDGGISLV